MGKSMINPVIVKTPIVGNQGPGNILGKWEVVTRE